MFGVRTSSGDLAPGEGSRADHEPLDGRHGQVRPIARRMSIDRRKLVVFGAAVALRMLLFNGFPTLPGLLTGRVEISTPVTSFKRCASPRAAHGWSCRACPD